MGGSSSRDIFLSAFESLKEANLEQKDEAFWEQVWTGPNSVDDIFSLTVDQLRDFRKNHPQNLSLLIEKIVKRLILYRSKYVEENANYLLNCIRLLLRLIPIVFEDSQSATAVFWTKKLPAPPEFSAFVKPSKLEEPDPPKDETKEGEQNKPLITNESHGQVMEPLAVRLLKVLIELLFLPGFTISKPQTPPPKTGFLLPLDHLWAVGIGVTEVMPSTTVMLNRRTEVLKCLLACFSESLYMTVEKVKSTDNRWLHYIACNSTYYSLGLFYSLLNVGCAYDPIGWGIPYNHLMFADNQEELTDVSLQTLALLLNFNPVSKNNHKNIFIGYLESIHKKEDFKFLTDSFVKLLNNPLQATRTYLPHSTKSIECHHEILMLLWKFLQYNKKYLDYICLQPEVLKIVIPILHFIFAGRKDAVQVQFVQLASFVLLVLSGERDFSVTLNTTYAEKPISGLPIFSGNFADFLFLVIHKLFIDSHERLAPFFECFLTILCNVSPYIKSLSMVTSITLLKMFDFISRPRYIFATENHHRYLTFLLEIFNNLVQYQYEGNNKLVYSILRHAETFQKLHALQLSDQPKPKKKDQVGETITETPTTPATIFPPSTEKVVVNENPAEKFEIEDSSENSFVPTQEWLDTWKQQLPISIPLKLIEALEPKIQQLITGSGEDEHVILNFLQNNTIVGILPVPHPIVIRKYVDTDATNGWFTVFAFGVIVKRAYSPPVFLNSRIQLFTLQLAT